MPFFGQNHKLTPLEKMRFFGKILFFKVKKVSFFLQSRQALFLVFFWSIVNKEKNWHFLVKSMSYAFGKMRFFWVWIILFFIVKRVSFFSAKSPSIILVLFWPNLNKPNNWNFFIKSMSYPLKKCDFLDFEKCCFLRSKKFFFLCKVRKHYF